MPERSPHTSFRSRQVATALRRHREATGMSCTQVAAAIGVSQSKISRIERGLSGLREADVAGLLGLYRVPAETRDELLDLLQHSDERGWWSNKPAVPRLWRGLMDVEDQATKIQNYEVAFVPGLLQTADYCRAVIEGANPALTDAEVDTLVATRMGRQTLLTRASAPQLVAVLDESALRRPIGVPGVIRRQLQHLLTVAEQPNVLLRVVPVAAGAHAGLEGPFSIVEFDDGPGVVFIENHHTGLFLEEPAELASYRTALGHILSAALAQPATVELIATLAAAS